MTGKGHIAAGLIAAVDVAAVWHLVPWAAAPLAIRDAFGAIADNMDPLRFYGSGVAGIAACVLASALYILGLLLPDIDNTSMISSALHFSLPLRHRGFTHSLWPVAAFAAIGFLWLRPVVYLALGMLAHDLADSLSKAGWVPLYPIGRYRIYNAHGKEIVCAKGRHLYFYSSDDGGEAVLNTICGVISAACITIGILCRIGGG